MVWIGATRAAEIDDPQDKLHEELLAREDRLTYIDAELERLEAEQGDLRADVRSWHRERHQLHERMMEEEDLQELRAEIEQKQRALRELQAELSRRVSEHPDYSAAQDQQRSSLDRHREIQRDIARLSEERVQVQLAIQALKRALQPDEKQAENGDAPAFNPALEVHPDL